MLGLLSALLAQPVVVAVFDIETSSVSLDPAARAGLDEYLFSKLAAVPRFKLVPRVALRERLRVAKAESYAPCYDEACQIELGKELAAEKSLAPRLTKLGDECLLTLALYDLASAATEAAADARGACRLSALLHAVERAVETLAGPAPTTIPTMGVEDPERCPGGLRVGEPYPAGRSMYCVDAKSRLHGDLLTWHEGGEIAARMRYAEGQLSGPSSTFYPDGRPFEVGAHEGGRKVGVWTRYDPNGVRVEESRYLDGLKSGVELRFDRHGKRGETRYVAGKRNGAHVEYHPNGEVAENGAFLDDRRTGVWEKLDGHGRKLESVEYRAGLRHGAATELDARGRKRSVTRFVDGVREGKSERHGVAGDKLYLEHEQEWAADQKHGRERWFDRDGHLLRETTWVRGVKDGPYQEWERQRDQRVLSERGEFLAGEKSGRWTRFDRQGRPKLEIEYRAGKRHGRGVEFRVDREGKIYRAVETEWEEDERHGEERRFDAKGTLLEVRRWERGAKLLTPGDASPPR